MERSCAHAARAASTASGSDWTGRDRKVETDSRQVVFMPGAYTTLQETEMRPGVFVVSGGFLLYVINHLWDQGQKTKAK